MQKLGYVLGTGLGQNGEGIVTPVSAQILPPGRSLDHCMELREKADGDKDLFSVERRLKRMKKKQEGLNAKAYAKPKPKDLFSFINNTIFSSPSPPASSKNRANASTSDFKSHSTQNLRVESFKISEDIRKKEREMQKIEESMRRHQNGSALFQQLSSQLNAKKSELSKLRKSETSLAKEQNQRKDKTKLTIF